MRTYEDESGIAFHFDGDLGSGGLRIVHVEGRDPVEVERYPGGCTVTLPAAAVLRLVARAYVAPRRVGAIEGAGWRELLA